MTQDGEQPRARPDDMGARRFEELFEGAGFGIAITDLDGRFVAANAVYTSIVGYTVDELRQRDFLSITHPDDRDLNSAGLVSLLRGEIDAFDLEKRYVRRDGEIVWIRGKATLIRGGDDESVNLVGTFEDITAAKATEQELARSEELRRIASELAFVGGWSIDADRTFSCAEEVFTILGLQRGDPPTLDVVRAMFPPLQRERVDAAVERALGRGEPFDLDLELETRSGRIPIRAVGRPQLDPGGRVVRIAGAVQDVSDLRRHEAALARQAALLDEATDAIIVRRLDHTITYWNRSAERLYGWTAEEAVGSDIRSLLHDNVARFDEADAELVAAGSWAGEFVLRSRSGARLIVAARWTLIRDAQGEPEAVLAINSDVTEQRRTELQLVRSQRLESIGTLAGGVAHDLNNTLSPILLASELLRDGEDDADRVGLLSTILDSARRGADLVAQLLSFARGVDGEREPVDIADLLNGVHRIVRETFPRNITVRVDVQAGLEPVVGDRTQLQQVLLNLAVNARDAMPGGGTITISASAVGLDGQYLVAADGAGPGRYVLIEVEDDGHGMAPDVLDHVFEPFFTTKEPGSGTGLGLSMAAGIVQSHGGLVRAYSEAGSGSRFRVYLPIAEEGAASQAAPEPLAAVPSRGAGETVLVVDDEDSIRAMTRRTLESAGYLVLDAANGAEGVAVFARHQDRIDVVLIDMMMPVMDGASAIHALRSLAPDVRVVAASGLHGNGHATRAVSAGVRHFLPKPYTSASLLEAIAEALGD